MTEMNIFLRVSIVVSLFCKLGRSVATKGADYSSPGSSSFISIESILSLVFAT